MFRIILPRSIAAALIRTAGFISVAAPLALVAYLVVVDIVPSGELSVRVDLPGRSPYLSPLHPGDRVSPLQVTADGVAYQTIRQQPVYFDMRIPRSLAELEVTLTYQNLDQPLVEVGTQASVDPWVFQLQGIEHPALDRLLGDPAWTAIREGDVVLLQREPRYRTLAEFLANPPPRETVATYRYDLPGRFTLPGYAPRPGGAQVSVPLRGTHRFATYAGADETLELTLDVVDLNRRAGADAVTVTVSRDGVRLQQVVLPDDGDATDRQLTSDVRTRVVSLDAPAAGLLRVELAASSDDIVFRRIATNLDYLAFTGPVTLDGGQALAATTTLLTLTTDATRVTAQTTHAEGRQRLQVGGAALDVVATHQPVRVSVPGGVKEITVVRPDVQLTTNGTLAFSREAWFTPDAVSLGSGVGFDAERIRTIIARYPESRVEDGWRTTTVRFPLLPQQAAAGTAKVAVSLPELAAGDQGLRLRRIQVRLLGAPLTVSDITRKLTSWVGRFTP